MGCKLIPFRKIISTRPSIIETPPDKSFHSRIVVGSLLGSVIKNDGLFLGLNVGEVLKINERFSRII